MRGSPGLARYLLVAVLLAAGLMSKQMLVTLPLVAAAAGLVAAASAANISGGWRSKSSRCWRFPRSPAPPRFGRSAPAERWQPSDQLPLALRLANAALSYLRYLGKTAGPSGLSVFYPFPLAGIAAWKVVGGAGGAGRHFRAASSSCAGAVPWLAVGWGWYVMTLLPVIGIVQVGMQAMADRYLYVPMIGLLIAMAWECAERWRDRRALPASAAVLLLALGVWHGGRSTSGKMG